MHCFFKFGNFLVEFVVFGFLGCHDFSAFLVLRKFCGRAFVIVCWLSNGQSVIEEKGEGFENGKVFVGLLVVPSTSICPHVIRLKILYSYKSYESAITKRENLADS